ncbi:MAG: hypothetical protein ABEJ27_07420 [Halodesulfurarchaeum sp.]
MDTERLKRLAPHWAAMLLSAYLVLGIIRILFGTLGFWVDLVIIAAVVFAYRPIVIRLGIAPPDWEQP